MLLKLNVKTLNKPTRAILLPLSEISSIIEQENPDPHGNLTAIALKPNKEDEYYFVSESLEEIYDQHVRLIHIAGRK